MIRDPDASDWTADEDEPSTSTAKRAKGSKGSQSKKYCQRFRSEWMKNRSWLKPSKKGTNFFSCIACKKDYTAGLSEIIKHENGEGHKQKCKIITSQQTLFKFSEENVNSDKLVRTAEIRLSAFISEHNLSFRISDHLTQLIKAVSPDSKITQKISCGRTKCSNIIKNVTGKVLVNRLINEMQKNKFSLLIDESTDKYATKHLCLVVRIKMNDRVQDCFLTLVPLADGTACNIYSKIIEYFKNNNVNYVENMIGFAADGANAMMGIHNSVRSLFSRDIPNIFIQKCICHSFALCASYAATKIPNDVEDLTRELYKYFQYSFKKTSEFLQFQNFAKVKPHKLLHPSQTRWLSVHQVVSRILEQWNALKLFFTDALITDRLKSTENIYEKLHNPVIKIYLEFLDYVLPFFNQLNLEMQSEHPKIHLLYQKTATVTKTLLEMFLKPDYLNRITALDKVQYRCPHNFLILDDVYLGGRVTVSLNSSGLSPTEISDVRKNCLSFLIEAVDQIYKRFDFQSLDFQLLEAILPENVKAKKHASIIPLAKELKQSGISENDYNELDREWRRNE